MIIHGTGGHSQENWFLWLKRRLEEQGIEVFVPDFPNSGNPNLDDWKQEFEKYEDSIDGETVLIGHSLGGTFLLKFLEKHHKMIEKVFFVASPVGIKPIRYYDGDLRFVENFNLNWNSIRETCKNFTVFHSDNDPYVCLENGKELSKQLEAKFIFISNSGHFNKDAGYIKFDRLLEEINL